MGDNTLERWYHHVEIACLRVFSILRVFTTKVNNFVEGPFTYSYFALLFLSKFKIEQ